MEHREVVVRSSMLMLRVWVDLDRTYMDGGATAGSSRDTDSHFSLVFLASDVIQWGIYSENVFY